MDEGNQMILRNKPKQSIASLNDSINLSFLTQSQEEQEKAQDEDEAMDWLLNLSKGEKKKSNKIKVNLAEKDIAMDDASTYSKRFN